jgi:uncharacterized protein (UPF0335 family)
MSMTQQELFDRLTTLETEKLTLAADIKQLKDDSKYDEDVNPQGLSKEDIKLIGAASRLEAKKDFEEKQEAANAVFKKYVELTGYDQ